MKLPSIKAIVLDLDNQTRDEDVHELLDMCSHLVKSLKLAFSHVTGEIFAGTAVQFEKLDTLVLSGCRQVTDRGLAQLLQVSSRHLVIYS